MIATEMLMESAVVLRDWIVIQKEEDIFTHDMDCGGESCVLCESKELLVRIVRAVEKAGVITDSIELMARYGMARRLAEECDEMG